VNTASSIPKKTETQDLELFPKLPLQSNVPPDWQSVITVSILYHCGSRRLSHEKQMTAGKRNFFEIQKELAERHCISLLNSN
jgi:hypothetical protein